MNDLAFKIAKCCNPLLGESVVGFISINGGITIHRTDCSNVRALKKNYPYRIIDVKWSDKASVLSDVTINVIGDNEFGLLSLISSTIKELNINIVNANFETKENRFVGKLVLQVSDTNLLDLLLKKLSSLKGIAEVKRMA
jgi:GTP pyrophosphokinase